MMSIDSSIVIMVSTLTVKDADVTIRAMELGATDFVTKPENISDAKGKGFSVGMTFDDIEELLQPLIEDELNNDGSTPLIDPYIS